MSTTKHIAVLPGDGIGPEVTAQAVQVLQAVCDRFGHIFTYRYADVGAIAIERHGDPLPEATLDTCLGADAILFGAIGHPRYDNDPSAPVRPEQGLLRLRKSLGLFANIRPVTLYPSLLHLSPLKEEKVRGVDFVIYRELTGGIYFGDKGQTPNGAYDHCVYTAAEIDRISRLAFEHARRRRNKITLVDKANVLETSRLWRKVVTALAASDYPDVTLDWMYVDNAAMQIIQFPAAFDVVLTENMFGDILSDEASMLTGSIGMLPSASLDKDNKGLYEPSHGSAPDIAGKGIANPLATILSAAMMLRYSLNQPEAADRIESAVRAVLSAGLRTADIWSEGTRKVGTREMGAAVVAELVRPTGGAAKSTATITTG